MTPKTAEELADCRVFLSDDGGVGLAIAPDGDIEAVFRNRDRHPQGGAMKNAIPHAISVGGTKLDCYGAGLVNVYSKAGGFVPVARVSFNPEYANPGWTADKGTPDIFVMMATDLDAGVVQSKQGSYHFWTDAELAALPLMEYDEAMAYRDRLLAERGITPGGGENPSGRGVGVQTALMREDLQSAQGGGTMGKAPRVSLGDHEEHAVRGYKSSESYTLNEALRDGLQMTPVQRRMMDGLDRALPKLPTYQGQVYRRIGFDTIGGQAAMDAFLAEHRPGTVVQYPAFTSASIEANGYPVDGELAVTIIIESESGRDMDGYGNNFEREIVFPRDSEFFVERVETDEMGKPVVYMKEVTSDGTGQLHSEEQHGRVQQMREVSKGDGHLRKVPEAHIQREASGAMPGLRGEGAGPAGVGAAERGFAGAYDQLQGQTPDSGFHQDGENAYRQVDVPMRDFDGRAIPKSAATVMEAQATPDSAVETIQGMIADGALSFDSITDKAALEEYQEPERGVGWRRRSERRGGQRLASYNSTR